MSKLVIVESPTKASNIKKYLGAGYDVMASVGHVRDLPAAKLSVDIKNDFAPKYAIIKGKEKLVKELKEKVNESEEVYLATDPDREGEAISWHLAILLGLDQNEKNRVKFNEINESTVKKGISNPEKIDLGLVNAQQARRILDRLVGYKLSPFISQKIRRGLSAGRVQSVAVRMIADREEEINAFVPEEYWLIDAKLLVNRRQFTASFTGDETGNIKLNCKAAADKILNRLEDADYSIIQIKKGQRKRQPAPPFTTSTLQQEASKRLGFQAQKTMKIAQELYEGVNIKGMGSIGLITYMRTDSLRISEQARADANAYINQAYGSSYLPEKPRYFKARAGAQDGHEAIRPTVITLHPDKARESLSSDQYKLYNLIWRRYLASLMQVCVQDTVKVEVKAVGAADKNSDRFCLFSASGYSVKFDGYTVLYEDNFSDDKEKERKLPPMKETDELKLKELAATEHFTQPPSRYSEASLIKALEETGVGRPSTYASIVSIIIKREYVVRENKLLKPTELGMATTVLLKERFPKIVNTKFTALMETKLDEVENGKCEYIAMLREFYDEFEATLQKAKAEMVGQKIRLEADITDILCEKCGKNMIIKAGRFGKFLACPGYPDCKNTKPIIETTDALCPRCGGKIIGKKTKKGYQFFGCSNYPECNFMTWDKPLGESCPKCGKALFKGRGGVISCGNEQCDYTTKAARKKAEKNE
ncbi:MAG: DNA topoisomerase 1 [Firmicutes bacterium ADurb.Bin300]|jgi:DNA topoisomerase-1|nr:MAG: DNA topoisomerase 1 [Firmicutes bacterium ADurb.Bin300]HOD01902.1 type I DNA topoisomerase [Clostridiales bacterium]